MATTGITLARAYVEIIPTVKGIQGQIGEALSGAEGEADRAGGRAGTSFSGKLAKTLKAGVIGAGVAAGGVLSMSLIKGFGRLSAIETAEAKLTGLGNSATQVSAIMDNALASVKGTSHGMDEAATTAASAVAAGVKPGAELQRYLTLVGGAATVAGSSMSDMGSIFNKVMTSGKVQGDVLAQLGDRGIPVVTMLAEHLGVTNEEVYSLASKGKISSADFVASMGSMEDAAKAAGNTTAGAWSNVMAALSRFGAAVLKGVFPLLRPAFLGLIGWIDAATDAVGPLATAFGGILTKAIDGTVGAVRLLATGDFKGGIFGLEEDSRVVDVLLRIREGALSVYEAVRMLITGDFRGGIFGLQEDSGVVDVLLRIREGALGIFESLKGLSGGGILGGALGVVGIIGKLGGFAPILAAIGPQVKNVIGLFGKLVPVLRFLGGPVGIILGLLTTMYVTNGEFRDSINSLLETIGGVVMTLIGALMPAVQSVASALVPFIASLAYIGGNLLGTIVNALVPVVTGLIDALIPALTAAGEVIAQVVGVVAAVMVPVLNVLVPIVGVIAKVVGVVLVAAFKVITPVLLWLANIVSTVLTVVFNVLADVLGWVASTVVPWITDALNGFVSWVADTAVPWLSQAWDAIKVAAGAVGEFFVGVWNGISGVIQVVADWIVNVLVPALQGAWNAIAAAAGWLWTNVLSPVWEGIRVVIAIAVAAVMTYIDVLVWYWQNVLAPVAMWLWNNVITPVWNGIQAAVSVAVTVVQAIVGGLVWFWQNVLAPAAMWLYSNVIVPVWNGIQTAIGFVIDVVKGYIAAWIWVFQNVLAPAFTWLWLNVVQPVWNGIQTAIRVVVDWFQNTAWPAVKWVIDTMVTGFGVMRDKIGDAWAWIKDRIIDPVVSWFRDTIKPVFDDVTSKIGASFDGLKDTIGKAWTAIQDVAKVPIDFVVNKVYNAGLKDNFNKVAEKMGISTRLPTMYLPDGFRTGGILPGQSRMADGDDQLVPMRRGEGVLVSEGLRDAASRSLFLAANAAARTGTSFASFVHQGYAGGGIIGDIWEGLKDVGGDAIDMVQKGWDFMSDALTDPAGAFTKLTDGLLAKIPGGAFADFAKEVPRKIASGIGDALGGVFASTDSGAVPATNTGARTFPNWQAQYAALKGIASSMGLVMTSNYRGGARTAQSGMTSLHALGRAVDWAGPAGGMSRFFDYVDANYNATELLYSPKGGRNRHRSGRRGPNTGATLKNHYSHVHAGFAGGGILDTYLHDGGGWHDPGTLSLNMLREPEAVLPKQQFADMHALAMRPAEPAEPGVVVYGGIHGHDVEEVADELDKRKRRRMALHVGRR